jgi:1,2-diacylglycerol 3-alpha-glucosyltransferase
LGRRQRGYENACHSIFNEFKGDSALDLRLIKTEGKNRKGEIVVRSLSPSHQFSQWLGSLLKKDSFYIESATFFCGLVFQILKHRPDVIYLPDCQLSHFLWYWKKVSKLKYRIVFFNGGFYSASNFRADFVQQITPYYYEIAEKDGWPGNRQAVIPHAFSFENFHPSPETKFQAREKLDLPQDRTIVLSVGAIDIFHKRIDYLIEEVSSGSFKEVFLVVLGEKGRQFKELEKLASLRLGKNNYKFDRVSQSAVRDYYKAADVFVLASIKESFGLVYVEALSYGLPCLVHGFPVSKFVCGNHAFFGDFTKTGELARLLDGTISHLKGRPDPKQEKARIDWVKSRFSWEILRPRYLSLLSKGYVE